MSGIENVEVNISFTLVGCNEEEYRKKIMCSEELFKVTNYIRKMLSKPPFDTYDNSGVMYDIEPCKICHFGIKNEDLP